MVPRPVKQADRRDAKHYQNETMSNSKATITLAKINNSKSDTSISKVIELVLVNSQLVPDIRELEAGVFSDKLH